MTEIERLLRKELRTERTIDPAKPILLVDEKRAKNGKRMETEVAALLLARIFEGRTKIIRVPTPSRSKEPGGRKDSGAGRTANLVRATTLEAHLSAKLREFLEDEKPSRGAAAPIMRTIPEKLIHAFARANGIDVETAKDDGGREGVLDHGKDDVHALLDRLQKDQPQTIPALRRSFEWLDEKRIKR